MDIAAERYFGLVRGVRSEHILHGSVSDERQRTRTKEPPSLFENYEGSCFRGKARMARRDEGGYPPAVSDRGATKPDVLFLENPPGGRSFACGLRWLGPYSPLRGCSALAALATGKIPGRRTRRSFQTGSPPGGFLQKRPGDFVVPQSQIPADMLLRHASSAGRFWRNSNIHGFLPGC